VNAVSRLVIVAFVLAALLAFVPGAEARPRDTTSQTIQDRDSDNRLEPAPGEEHLVREELAEAKPTRTRTRERRIFFGQMTDLHVVDEESPLRVEFLDKLGPPLTSAYRPQEAMTTQVLDSMVRQIRNSTSPIAPSRPLELVMTTGDNSDNTQFNETRWMIDTLDGDKQVNPDSGIPGSCGSDPSLRYHGVRDDNEYYEPDSSRPAPGSDTEDGPGYSPDREENKLEAQRDSSVRDFPDLFEQANEPFRPTGLGLPWYGIFGNHDALIQGNQPRNAGFEAIATGCPKVKGPSTSTALTLARLIEDEKLTRDEADEALAAAVGDLSAAAGPPAGGFNGTLQGSTQMDPDRRPLRKQQFVEEHFKTTGAPVGHGFTPENKILGEGQYVTFPKPGLRFLVLDSINEGGGDGGNIDDKQFRWIHAQLREAETAGELVMLFAHHSLRTMDQEPLSPFVYEPGPDGPGGYFDPVVHFGNGPRGSEERPSECEQSDPVIDPAPDETLRCLLLRHPSAVAFVNGHEHNNRIEPVERRDGVGPVTGGFWEINTAAHIDWPQQSRVLDLFDNRDGTLSIFGTIIDHAAATNPGGPQPDQDPEGDGRATANTQRLASISRELSFNDPDSSNGQDGRGDARGGLDDRNVELLVRDPYAAG